MNSSEMISRKEKILIGIYSSSWGISMTTLSVVAALEIFMLVYSVINTPLYGPYLWTYRAFYIFLLTLAVVYILLYLFVKRDMAQRYKLLNIANPICASFFFAWSIFITYFDFAKTGFIDPTVFMTFSLTVPLSFYLFPSVFAVIVAIVDGLMLYLTSMSSGGVGPLINLAIFFIFQFVLGISFLRLKMRLSECIVQEQKNAEIDIMTGFFNRRAYEAEITRCMGGSLPEDLVYITLDMNELKEVNDSYGHEAGDRLIIGAAHCMEQCFGRGKLYRIGGDEFVVLISAGREDLENMLRDFEQSMRSWSAHNGLSLSTSCGCVRAAEYPSRNIRELAKEADQRMYEAKNRYYQMHGKDRRRAAAESSPLHV